MDDIRLSKFVIESINNKNKIPLYTNIFFSPVLSSDFFKVIKKIIQMKLKNKVIHCSGNRRINKYDFYSKLIGKKNYFLKEKVKISKFHPKDLSLSNKFSSVLLNYKFTNFESSIKEAKKIIINQIMKILITVPAGYIGCKLVPMLLKENHQVIGFDNLTFGYHTLLPHLETKISNLYMETLQK